MRYFNTIIQAFNHTSAIIPRLSLLLLSFICSTHLFSQNFLYNYKRIIINPYVADNDVTNLVEDSLGMLWLSTINSLYRFDGYGMENISIPSTNNKNQAITINKLVLFEQQLIIASNKGLKTIATHKSKFNQSNVPSPISAPVTNIVTNPEHGLIYITENGTFYKFHHSITKRVQLPAGKFSASSNIVVNNGKAYIASVHSGIYIIDLKTFTIVNRINLPKNDSTLFGIHPYKKGLLIITEKSNNYEYDAEKNTIKSTRHFGKELSEICFLPTDAFTVNNINKLFHQYAKDGKTIRVQIDLGAEKAERIHRIYQLKDKIFVTTTNGLVALNYRQNNFQTIHETYNRKNNSFEVPRGITEDEKFYFLATYENILKFNKITHVKEFVVNKALYTHGLVKQHDTLWLATEGKGFKKINLKTNTFSSGNILRNEAYKQLICIVQLTKEKLLLGGYECLLLYDLSKKNYKKIEVLQNNKDITTTSVNQIIPVDSAHFYIATGSGVFYINDQGAILKKFGRDISSTQSLKTHAIWISKDTSIWAGTSEGLYHFSNDGSIRQHLTRQDGLAGDRIAAILKDQNNHLWVSTFTGLSSIDLHTGVIKNFNKEDGLPDNEFNHGSAYHTINGQIILGTMNGFVLFNPDKLNREIKITPRFNISKVEFGNQEVQQTRLVYKDIDYDTIKLGKGINYAKLQFYLSPLDIFQKTQYEYKIEGLHKTWIRLGASPILTIDNFKPGEYTLQIRAITGFGSKDVLTKTMPIIVDEYFYKTNWFFVLLSLIITLLIVLYFSVLIRRDRRIVQLRQQIAEDLHDEVGSYLTGISMSIDLMQRKKGKEQLYYQTIQTLGKKALKSLKDSIWSLDNRSDNALQLWDRVKNLASETYAPLEVHFSFKEISGLEKINLTILEKTYLFYAIKECITNSIKHGDGKTVQFSWEKKEDHHLICIKNSYEKSSIKEENGHGLYNIESRMKKIKAQVNFQKEYPYFTVLFKLKFSI